MQYALKLAILSSDIDEVPVGALLVSGNIMLGKGWNKTISASDPSCHAEIISIRQAASNINNYRHRNSIIYVTNEPCVMCMGVIMQARINKIVFASRSLKNGADFNIFCLTGSRNRLCNTNYHNYILTRKQCSSTLRNFFKKKRFKKNY